MEEEFTEPEVHIIEKYFQTVRQCFTMTNIRLKRNKEIDLLAANLQTSTKYHVESRIATSPSFWLRSHETKTKSGRYCRNGLDYFHREKFNHPIIMKKIHDLFGDSNYRKWLVVWNVQNENVITEAIAKYGIEIYWIHELIENLRQQKLTSGSRDVVLRMIELFGMDELMRLNLRVIDLKRDKLENKLR